MNLSEKYPHLNFPAFEWQPGRLLTEPAKETLIRISAITEMVKSLPLGIEAYEIVYELNLVKGIHATAAIEGNSLSEEQVGQIIDGKSVDKKSLDYAEREIKNLVTAYRHYVNCLFQDNFQLISEQVVCDMHRMIGAELGADFKSVPGRFREHYVTVGGSRPPDYSDVPALMRNFFEWLQRTFHYADGNQNLETGIIQALSAHYFFELLHPFGDGNGRTGRLLEFYLMLRAGMPLPCAVMTANHYNNTRERYYRYLKPGDTAANPDRQAEALREFIAYALEGLFDGIRDFQTVLTDEIWKTAWKEHVYQTFDNVKAENSNKVNFRRQRKLALLLPLNEKRFTVPEVPFLSPQIQVLYFSYSSRTLDRDVKELLKMELILPDAEGKYCLNINRLKPNLQPSRKSTEVQNILSR